MTAGSGDARRARIVEALAAASGPLSGTALAEMLAGNETLAGLTEFSGITIQKLGNQDIYVDSISYTPKA